jgi:hypothetical protein
MFVIPLLIAGSVSATPVMSKLEIAMASYYRCMDAAGAALEPSGEPAETVARAARFRCIEELEAIVEIQKADFISDSPAKELVAKHGEQAIGPWILKTRKKVEDWGVERALTAVIEARARRGN